MEYTSILQELLVQKDKLLSKIINSPDFRPGSLVERYRRCGKPYCHCAKPGEKGHGPSFSLTRSVKGKTITKIIQKDEVETTQQQIQAFHRFQNTVTELVETKVKICDTKLAISRNTESRQHETEKKG